MKNKPFTTLTANQFTPLALLLALVLSLVLLAGQVQAQSFGWARKVTGKYSNTQLLVLPNGDYFVAGVYTGDLTIGPFKECGVGGSDVFVAYFKGTTGEPYWLRRIAGPETDEIGGMSYADGFLYITGSFRGKAIVDNFKSDDPMNPCGSLLARSIQSSGESDIFIVRYFAYTGALQWAARAGGPGRDKGQGIKVVGQAESGNLILSGYFTKESSFHSIDANSKQTKTLTVKGEGVHRDAFLAHYQIEEDVEAFPTLNLKWAQRVGAGQGDDYGAAVDVDNNGFIYLTGGFSLNFGFFSSIDQKWTWLITPAPQGSLNSDIFVAKYTLSGAFLWANKAGGTGSDAGTDLVVDATGNAYVAGHYQSGNTIFYRNLPQGSIPLIKPIDGGSFDGFLAKYKPNGVVEWVNTVSGEQGDDLEGVEKAPNGDIVVAGAFIGNAKLHFTGGNQPVVSTGGSTNRDVLVVQYQPDGKLRWKLSGGGAAVNSVASMGVSKAGEVYIAGFQTEKGIYGQHQIPQGSDFVVKINPPLGFSARVETEEVEEAIEETAALADLIAYPVPTSSQATFEFIATTNEFASLIVFDAKGATKATLFQGQLEAGKHYQFILNIDQYNPGIYLAKLTSFSRTLNTKIVVNR